MSGLRLPRSKNEKRPVSKEDRPEYWEPGQKIVPRARQGYRNRQTIRALFRS